MSLLRIRNVSIFALAVLLGAGSHAFGALSASATISAAPDGSNFDYTIQVTNTGTDNIGTFWFAWTPPQMPTEYDFLSSNPSSASGPAGWVAPAPFGFPGYSIEFYNITGSPISTGQTDTFQFTTSDSPTALQQSTFGFKNTTSFIYSGFPEVGATAEVSPTFVVPEPSSLILVTAGFLGAMWRPRRKAC